jgi:hypothetical protein
MAQEVGRFSTEPVDLGFGGRRLPFARGHVDPVFQPAL